MQGFCLPKFSTVYFVCGEHSLTLKKEVEVAASASFSPSSTIGSYLSFCLPQLGPPGCPKSEIKVERASQFPNDTLFYSIYFQPWCDYITSLFWNSQRGFINKTGTKTEFICYITDKDYYQQLKEHGSDYFTEIQKHIQIPQSLKTIRRKIRIFNFTWMQFETDMFKPRVNTISFLTGIWYENGDEWRMINIFKNEIPTDEEFSEIDTIILTGSRSSIEDNHPEVKNALLKIQEHMQKNKKLKIIGICFGHQGLCKYFGCQIVRHEYQYGLGRVFLDKKKINQIPLLNKLPAQLLIAQAHQDSTKSAPQNWSIFGESPICKTQCMISNDLRYLSFQYHPEYSVESLIASLRRVNGYMKTEISKQMQERAKKIMQNQSDLKFHAQSNEHVRYLIRAFIDQE